MDELEPWEEVFWMPILLPSKFMWLMHIKCLLKGITHSASQLQHLDMIDEIVFVKWL